VTSLRQQLGLRPNAELSGSGAIRSNERLYDFMKKEKRIKTIEELRKLQHELLPCPFCGCKMGILIDGFGFTLKHSQDKTCECFIGSDSFSSYGCADNLAEDWNNRIDGI